MQLFAQLVRRLQHQPPWVLLPAAVGLYQVAKLCFVFLPWIYTHLLRRPKDLRVYGSWALVTGPTDGIGKAMSFRLADQGLNLVLVGRNPDKLTSVSEAIRAAHPEIRLESVVLDFAGDTAAGVRRIRDLCETLEVGVVVNNAGVAFSRPMLFHEVEERAWKEVLRVNLEGPTAVTRAVLPPMLERRRGAIVNVGSASAGVLPSFPFYSIYAGTKGYLDVLSRSLHLEYGNEGIHVQCQVPVIVGTKIIHGLIPDAYYWLLATSTESYARAAVSWIGYGSWCIPCWHHSLQACAVRLVPECIVDRWLVLMHETKR